MANPFSGMSRGTSGPASRAFPIAPSNVADTQDASGATIWPRALYVGGAGHLVVTLMGDATPVTLHNIAAGTLLPVSVKRVHATGTTATNIVGLY